MKYCLRLARYVGPYRNHLGTSLLFHTSPQHFYEKCYSEHVRGHINWRLASDLQSRELSTCTDIIDIFQCRRFKDATGYGGTRLSGSPALSVKS